MTVVAVVTVFGVGLAVGVLSGLVGIGGGVLIVPFLYFFYAHPAWFGVAVDPGAATVVAHATSLFAIVPTALRGTLMYHRSGLVVWGAVWPIAVASTITAVGAAQLATVLPPELLRLGFGLLLLYSAARLALDRREPPPPHPQGFHLSLPATALSGGAAGAFSALMGVGGGIVLIPVLINVVGIEVRRVAATSMGIVVITASAGVAAYVAGGIGEPGRPPWSAGYVDLAVGTVLFLGALLSVKWGTVLNQRLKPRVLALVFAGLFALVGARLVLENLGVG